LTGGAGEHREDLLAVGRILRPHGNRGALVVEPMSDEPGRFLAGALLLLQSEDGAAEVEVLGSSGRKGKIDVVLDGVNNREQAERLRGRLLFIEPESAVPLSQDEYWIHDLIGMSVSMQDGEMLGEVVEFREGTAQDLLVVAAEDEAEIMIPFVGEFVEFIDAGERVITVRLIPGMLPQE
jgi:16S rRNA processing protein RimM